MKQLEDAFNTNTKVFSDGIQMLEAQNAVLRQVVGDVLRGQVRLVNCGVTELPRLPFAGCDIDWNGYLKKYIEALADKEEEQKDTPAGSILATPDEDAPIVFGGK